MLYTLFMEQYTYGEIIIMDDIYEISLLLDFYGQLLTDRQFEILDLHYNCDYSLGEIAEQLDISRQGVYDNIRKAKSLLNGFEERLQLLRIFSGQKAKSEEILKQVKSINKSKMNDIDRKRLKIIEEGIMDIINVGI